jgi:hypothetical protein
LFTSGDAISSSIFGVGYTVPVGKRLYILSIRATGVVDVNGYEVGAYLSYDTSSSQLSQPIILDEGDVISSSGGGFSGILVDENYFSNYGGGGSSSATSSSSNSLVSLPVIYPDSTGINSNPTINNSYGDMVMNYSDGSVFVLAPGLDNNNLDYLFTSMATCGGSATNNQEHYISFQVIDTIIVKEKFQVLNYNGCSAPTGYPPLIYRHTNTVNFDPNIDGIGSSTETNMLFPGFTYSMRCRVYMTNMGSQVHNFKIGSVSQFTVNPFFTNVSYFQQNYSDATFYTSTQFPVLQDLGFSFSLPIPVWIGL